MGHQPPGVRYDESLDLPQLGDLLAKRTEILSDWLADDSLWEDL